MKIINKIIQYLIFFLSLFFIAGANLHAEPTGELIIFHAGSLSIPFKEMSKAFHNQFPKVKIHCEASGSRTCARKIVDLGRPCDVMASADYTVIENLLMPDYADWNISFATNEMALMYRYESQYSKEINSNNWYKILMKKGIEYGHSDPNSDPCGYRSQLVWQLAEKYYKKPGLYQALKDKCPLRNIRPKETDLIAMLEVGQIDYLFIYRSVCEQHHKPFVKLPNKINLRSSLFRDYYKHASIMISGRVPGQFIEKVGKPMVYGITIPKNAPNRDLAIQFVGFVLGPFGQEIMKKNGQPAISPAKATGKVALLSPFLKQLLK